jgi:DNA-binding transcriptional MerR regulator
LSTRSRGLNSNSQSRESFEQDGLATLTISAISEATGVSIYTIRAWEKRYSSLTPDRTSTLRRQYKQSDVIRLKLLDQLVSKGHSIAAISRLTTEALDAIVRLPSRSKENELEFEAKTETDFLEVQEDCLKLIAQIKVSSFNEKLLSLRKRLNCNDFAIKLAAPLIREVGDKVLRAELSIAQEHACSAVLRAHLCDLFFRLNLGNQKKSRMTATVSAPEGDFHEFGILLSAIILAENGVKTTYLGPNLPSEELANASNELRTDLVLIGTTDMSEGLLKQPLFDYLQVLDRRLNKATEVWIGGSGRSYPSMGSSLDFMSRNYIDIKRLDELEAVVKSRLNSITL